MTLQEFITKYTNKKLDYDGWYGAQCMDLMHQYIDEVLLNRHSPETLRAPSAKQAFINFQSDTLFEKIVNTPMGIPQEGDIMFWGGGEWGHVAIYIDGDVNVFNSFDQNYPTGSSCHVQEHNYENVLGWVRYREQLGSCEEIRLDRDYQEREKIKYKEEARKQRIIIDELTDEIQAKNQDIERLQEDNAQKNATITELTNQISTLTTQRDSLLVDKRRLEEQLDTAEDIIDAQSVEIDMLEKKLQKCKDEGSLFAYSWRERFLSLFIRGGVKSD